MLLENVITPPPLFGIRDLQHSLFCEDKQQSPITPTIKKYKVGNTDYFQGEFWTAKQRQASSIHEVSYRACFKPQLPAFFINAFTVFGDTVYDPFAGRGTTIIEAARLGRKVIANDINPISRIFAEGRLTLPKLHAIKNRLDDIPFVNDQKADIDLSMFYHNETEAELVSLKKYLQTRKQENIEDNTDKWIRMVATNRLTGHSPGFFSVYTFPPNQAISAKRQLKINQQHNRKPEYRNVKAIIIKKSKQLLSGLSDNEHILINNALSTAQFYNVDARVTKNINNNSVKLTVTSPPFLDVVQYADDNWLRCWFNDIDIHKIEKNISMAKNINSWELIMQDVLTELFRITTPNGHVAFEVGEVRGGKINLDEHIIPLGQSAGFKCLGVMINSQEFTKTSNLWGVSNNSKGTNSNRIVVFQKII